MLPLIDRQIVPNKITRILERLKLNKNCWIWNKRTPCMCVWSTYFYSLSDITFMLLKKYPVVDNWLCIQPGNRLLWSLQWFHSTELLVASKWHWWSISNRFQAILQRQIFVSITRPSDWSQYDDNYHYTSYCLVERQKLYKAPSSTYHIISTRHNTNKAFQRITLAGLRMLTSLKLYKRQVLLIFYKEILLSN